MSWSSRERLQAALSAQKPDHVPCAFMIFAALSRRCTDWVAFVEAQMQLGLDVVVKLPFHAGHVERRQTECGDLPGFPIRFGPEVRVRDWREDPLGERYPILHREYVTPGGRLQTAVVKTEDWVHGDRVPLFDDFVIPRARRRLIATPADLEALRYLLPLPTAEDLREAREANAQARRLAERHGLLTEAGWGVLFDAACWLAGIEELVIMAMDQPDFFRHLLSLLGEWNRRRMEFMLEEKVDLFVRRAWYETTAFLSPDLYRQFILPELRKDVALVHQAGARFAIISTQGYRPLLETYLEAGVDALIGVDPLQDRSADLIDTKRRTRGRMALWGGVNGFLTVERGTPEEVRCAVREAMATLAPGGGFVLSPVDNVTRDAPQVWENVRALIDEWQRLR